MTLHPWLATRLTLILVLVSSAALAQPYPSRPVKIVVPATTGGAIDQSGNYVAPGSTGTCISAPSVFA